MKNKKVKKIKNAHTDAVDYFFQLNNWKQGMKHKKIKARIAHFDAIDCYLAQNSNLQDKET